MTPWRGGWQCGRGGKRPDRPLAATQRALLGSGRLTKYYIWKNLLAARHKCKKCDASQRGFATY